MDKKLYKESAVMAATACATLADAMRHHAEGDWIAYTRRLQVAESELARAVKLNDEAFGRENGVPSFFGVIGGVK